MSWIMSWNIEKFGVNKLLPNPWDVNGLRELDILSTVQESGAQLFAVIEVQTGAGGGFGALITNTGGTNGVLTLLMSLRANVSANWDAVPPLIITPNGGYSEGIAVFFDRTAFEFCGPLLWTAAGTGPVAAGGGVAYAAPWNLALPAGNNHLGIAQNTMAGQCRFFDAGGAQVNFHDNNCRSLWQTKFRDLANGRTLNLFTVHFPPAAADAREAFASLALAPAITGALAANEDRVVCGDFNVDALNVGAAAVFGHLTGGPGVVFGYPVSTLVYAQMINVATNLMPVKQASTTGANPYYNYVRSNGAGNFFGLDNIFVARQGGAAAPANANAANRVLGGGGFTVDMVRTIPAINAPLGAPGYIPPGGGRARTFRTLVNFGHIGGRRGTSDHMPVVVQLP